MRWRWTALAWLLHTFAAVRVLVVDDSAYIRVRVASLMRARQVAPTEAASFEEAAALAGEPFAAAVLDVELGDRSGIELAALLLARNPSLRVCFLTSSPEAARSQSAERFGPVFTKEWDLAQVLAWLGLAGPVAGE